MIIQNDQYQSAVYLNQSIWTLSFTAGPDVIPVGTRTLWRPAAVYPPSPRPVSTRPPSTYRPSNPSTPGN